MRHVIMLYSAFAALLSCPVSGEEAIVVTEDVVYTESIDRPKTLVIAVPAATDGPVPAIVHFHGGGFRKGSASRKTAEWLAREGFVGVSVNYTLSGEAIFPAAIHDCKAAIRWLRSHADAYGVDPGRVGVFGGSAGGHLAALVATSMGEPTLEGDRGYASASSDVQAVVANYPPTDFLRMNDMPGKMDHDSPTSPESAFIGGPIQDIPEAAQKANPIAYVNGDEPPTLLIHGRKDMSVPFNQSELLYDVLTAAARVVRLVAVENAGHGFRPDPENAAILPSRDEIKEMTMAWFRTHLSTPD